MARAPPPRTGVHVETVRRDPDLWHHLLCLLLGHDTISYSPELWLVLAETGWVPANRALCRRCHWRGYRTTWGVLVARGQAPAE